MGFDVTGTGLRIVLDAQVPAVVNRYIREDVDAFLADHGLTRRDVEWWVCHGRAQGDRGARGRARDPREAVQLTWGLLARIGNLSSASVLHVLEDTLRDRPRRRVLRHRAGHGTRLLLELVLVRATTPSTAEAPRWPA